MRIWPGFAAFGFVVLMSSGGSAGTSIERIVAFGDSLSDPGNAYVLTGAFEVRPFEPIPRRPI
jgi:phospholipase/lecithinase/hemolysin